MSLRGKREERITQKQDILYKAMSDMKIVKLLVDYACHHDKGNEIIEPLVKIFHTKCNSFDYMNLLIDLELNCMNH
jgi:hypothetical protein